MINLYDVIREECSIFLNESKNIPLIKSLNIGDKNVRKVKVRIKKKNVNNDIVESFNNAFSTTYNNIYGRAIFCNGKHKQLKKNDMDEEVYVFPINGFKFLYNPNVEYHMEYEKTLKTLEENMSELDPDRLLTEMIEYSYASGANLDTALLSDKEIIIYNIPYFYAVKKNKFSTYSELLSIVN